MGKADLRIDWATHEAAKYACVNWHYSKCIPVGKLVKVGAWENEKFVGVILFARGATPNLGSPYGLSQDECVELVRIAMTKHEASISRMVSLALKFLKKSNPKLKMIVSFADQSQGHHGGIYQAGNWTYTGQGSAAKFYMIHGRLTHPRTLGSANLTQNLAGARKRDPNAKVVEVVGKHRYLMPLDDETKQRILPLSKPYPKRVKQAMTDIQSEQRQGGTDPHAPNGLEK